MAEMEVRLLEAQYTDLERRVGLLEEDYRVELKTVRDALADVKIELAGLKGRLTGYLLTATVIGSVIVFIAQKVFMAGS